MRDLITQMIVTSDNTAMDIIIHRVGPECVNRMLDSLGYRETRLRMPIGQLFHRVWKQLDPSSYALTDRVRAAIGHNTGDWLPIIGNDVGIIYAPTGPRTC